MSATVPEMLPHERACLDPLLAKFKGAIDYDSCIVGIGKRNEFGEVVPVRCLCWNVPTEFLAGYADIAEHDAAAQLFVSHATSVLAISSLDDYPFDDTPHGKVGAYLRQHGIAFLLLCGVSSSRGLAWATFFRKDRGEVLAKAQTEMSQLKTEKFRTSVRSSLGQCFSIEECERASYLVRSGLFEWQEACGLPTVKPPRAERYRLIPLLPSDLDVALRLARGYAANQIYGEHGELGISRSTYDKRMANMTALGLTPSALAERLLGELPPPRIDKHPRRGPKLKDTASHRGDDLTP